MDPIMRILYLSLFALVVVLPFVRSNGVCHDYVVCPIKCPQANQKSLEAIIMPMFTFQDFRTNMENAIEYIKKYKSVISTSGGLKLHTSLNYFCCMTEKELFEIAQLLLQYPWTPLNVTFDKAVCNLDPLDPDKISIVAFADDDSQKRMGDLALAVEEFLISKGVKLQYRRKDQEPFHATMAQVSLDYPVADVLAYINKKIKKFNRVPAGITLAMLTSPPVPFKLPSNNSTALLHP